MWGRTRLPTCPTGHTWLTRLGDLRDTAFQGLVPERVKGFCHPRARIDRCFPMRSELVVGARRCSGPRGDALDEGASLVQRSDRRLREADEAAHRFRVAPALEEVVVRRDDMSRRRG